MATGDQLGERTVTLVDDVFMLAILRELQRAPAHAKDISRRADGVSVAGVRSRLRLLARDEFVVAVDETGRRVPPHVRAPRNALHEMTDVVGPAVLEMIDECEGWERRWFRADQLGDPGMLALGHVADPASRAIVRALADGPLRTSELEARVPEVAHTLLFGRLAELTEQQLLLREGRGRNVSYTLRRAIRELATVMLRAAHCESLRATAEDRSLSADSWGLLHVVAPLAEIPTGLTGILLVHVESPRIEDVYLSAAAGRITALAVPPLGEPQATAGASTLAWCDVFFGGDPAQIPTDADPGLVSAIFLALTRAMHPSGPANLDE
jgi:DNA-binding HxlR family transcriptional regulator